MKKNTHLLHSRGWKGRRYPSFPYLIPQESVTASQLTLWVLLCHQLVSPFSRNSCWEWGKHSWYILKGSPSDSYYPVSHIQLFSFAVLCFMSFFSLCSVFTVLWIVMWLPSIGEPWELAGTEWLACKRAFFPPSSSTSPPWKQPWRAIRWKKSILLPAPAQCQCQAI